MPRLSKYVAALTMNLAILALLSGPVWAQTAIGESQVLFHGQRFPSIVVAMDGTVLAFSAHKCPVVVRRSVDGGNTWEDPITVGDAPGTLGSSVVDETTGDILVIDITNQVLYRSKDIGRTWTKQALVIKPDRLGGVGSAHGADSGITLRHGTHAGRLIMAARVNGPLSPSKESNDISWWPYHYNTAIYSDDGGNTWQTSDPFPVLGTGEGTIAELSDGTLYYNSRCHMADDAKRRAAWSRDGGHTWVNPVTIDELPDGMRGTQYGCAGGVVRLDWMKEDVLVYSNLDGDGGYNRAQGRVNATVWASLNGGKTWSAKRRVYDGPSGYSSLAVGRKGTPSEGMVYMLYEGGPDGWDSDINVVRFDLDWIVKGDATEPQHVKQTP